MNRTTPSVSTVETTAASCITLVKIATRTKALLCQQPQCPGFYDVNDSPGAAASWNDRYTTMNRDNQKRYAGEAMKTFAKYGNTDARSYTNESMENALSKSTQYSFDRADRQTGHVFGDIWNSDYITEDWKMPSRS